MLAILPRSHFDRKADMLHVIDLGHYALYPIGPDPSTAENSPKFLMTELSDLF
jgi:hypothetical protein